MEVSPVDLRAVGKTSRDLLNLVESLGYRMHKIRRGEPAAQIMPSAVPIDFAATNILCIPNRGYIPSRRKLYPCIHFNERAR